MTATLIADHLESVLLEIQFASQDIARRAGNLESSSDDIEKALLRALETARQVLEGALDLAAKNGLPKLAIEAD